MNDIQDTPEKQRNYRDRVTKERKTADRLKDEERHHPLHTPYKRKPTNWKDVYDKHIEDN